MIGATVAIFQPARREDLHARLAALNLELWCFEEALARGAAEAASYSAGAPKAGPELGRWLRTVEQLHHGVIALQAGWERPQPDPLNQPTWINPSLRTALVVSSGDENTGEATFSQPTNRNPKGLSFGALVAANGQASFFDVVSSSGEMVDITETWVFLYHMRSGSLFSELSLPVVMPGAYIEAWRERIILPPFDIGGGVFEQAPEDQGPAQDFNFTIERR